MQEPGLQLRPGELVPGVGPGSPHSNKQLPGVVGKAHGKRDGSQGEDGGGWGGRPCLTDLRWGSGRPCGVLFLDVPVPVPPKVTLNGEAVVCRGEAYYSHSERGEKA